MTDPLKNRYNGRYELWNSGNFDTYMKAMGVSESLRSIGKTTHSWYDIAVDSDGDQWTFKMSSSFKSIELKFRLGKEFDEVTMDDRKVKTTFTFENGKLIQRQKATKAGEKDSDLIRELLTNNEMLVTLIAHEPDGSVVKAHRFYHRKIEGRRRKI